jgi:hypothetical protein
MTHTNKKKKFHVLRCWMFSLSRIYKSGSKILPVDSEKRPGSGSVIFGSRSETLHVDYINLAKHVSFYYRYHASFFFIR